MATRQEINRSILNALQKINEEYPDLRFGQLIINCGITVDTSKEINTLGCHIPRHEVAFYEESLITANRLIKTLDLIGVTNGKKDTSTTTKKTRGRKSKKSSPTSLD